MTIQEIGQLIEGLKNAKEKLRQHRRTNNFTVSYDQVQGQIDKLEDAGEVLIDLMKIVLKENE